MSQDLLETTRGTFETFAQIYGPLNTKELSLAYKELLFSSAEETGKKRAKEIFESAQHNPNTCLTDELLYVSLTLIDLNDPQNILGLINIFQNNADFRNSFFDGPHKKSSRLEIPYSLDDVSPNVFRETLGEKDYKTYLTDKREWIKSSPNYNDGQLDLIFKNNSLNIQLTIDRSKVALQKKFETDKDFAYHFFAQLNIPNGEASIPSQTLVKLAKLNPGAALGILVNPKLRSVLLPALTVKDRECLNENAKSASNENPRHKHYYRVTRDLLSPNNFLSSLVVSKNPDEFLSTSIMHTGLSRGLKTGEKYGNFDFLKEFAEESGSTISTYAELIPEHRNRESNLKKVVGFYKPYIKTLVSRYAEEKNPEKKASLKKETDLLFSDPAISNKLALSLDELKIISGCSDEDFNAIKQNQNNLAKFISKNYNANDKEIPVAMAFIIVNTPSLWEQLNPPPSLIKSVLKKTANLFFGLLTDYFKDNVEAEKAALKKLSPIFERKLNNQPLMEPKTTETQSPAFPATPVGSIDTPTAETPQNSRTPVGATPVGTPTASTPQGAGTQSASFPITPVGNVGTPRTPVGETPGEYKDGSTPFWRIPKPNFEIDPFEEKQDELPNSSPTPSGNATTN